VTSLHPEARLLELDAEVSRAVDMDTRLSLLGVAVSMSYAAESSALGCVRLIAASAGVDNASSAAVESVSTVGP
jgi:hypothetical protein